MNMKAKVSRFFIYLILIFGAFTSIFPFYWLIRSSFMTTAQIFELPPIWIPNPFRFKNYIEPFTVLPFGRYYFNSALVVLSVLVGVVATSALSAYSFSRLRWKWRDRVFTVILSSMMLPFAVTMIPTFIGWQSIGLVGTYFPLIVPAYFGGGAFNIFLLRQFFLSIPKELDEAAYADGAGKMTIFLKVIVPLSKSALIVVAIFTFFNTWNDFLGPLIYLNSEQKFTLALGLFQFQSMYTSQWNLLMAAATLVILPIVIVFMIGQKYIIEGITLTGIKA
jgi:multiple sugar transport system permease protein